MSNTSQGERRFWENYAMWKDTSQEHHITKDLLRVDWKSDKNRGMEYGHVKLTPVMFECLKGILLGKGKKPQGRTIEALRRRGLVDIDGQLTNHGHALVHNPA